MKCCLAIWFEGTQQDKKSEKSRHYINGWLSLYKKHKLKTAEQSFIYVCVYVVVFMLSFFPILSSIISSSL